MFYDMLSVPKIDMVFVEAEHIGTRHVMVNGAGGKARLKESRVDACPIIAYVVVKPLARRQIVTLNML